MADSILIKRKEFQLEVNYDRMVEELLGEAHFDTSVREIRFSNFPSERRGLKKIDFDLLQIDGSVWVSYDAIMHEIGKLGYTRPSDLKELLTFAIKHPEAQREMNIVALDSQWDSFNGWSWRVWLFPYLTIDRSGGRHIGLCSSKCGASEDFPGGYGFLVLKP